MHSLLGNGSSGLSALLRDDKEEDLRLLYWLYRRVPGGLDSVLHITSTFIKEAGKTLMDDPERSGNPVSLVEGLLELRGRMDRNIDGKQRGKGRGEERRRDGEEEDQKINKTDEID